MNTARAIALTAAAIVPLTIGWFTWALCRTAAQADRWAEEHPLSGEQ